MPTLSLRDNLGLDLQIEPAATSAMEKYFKILPELLIAGQPIYQIASLTLENPALTSFQTGLQVGEPVPLGTDQLALTIKAGLNGSLQIFVPDPQLAPGQTDSLFSPDHYGEDVPVKSTERYVSLGFTGTVSSSITAPVSDLRFGFNADSSASLTNYRKFSTFPHPPTVSEAIRETIAHFQLPGSIEDLQALEPDTVVAVSGSGDLKFSAAASLAVAPNPLALPDLPLLGAVKVSPGASITVGGSYRLSGSYEIRVHKVGPHTVRLGYYKERGSQWTASVTAGAGLGAGFGSDDLLTKIISAISPDTQADLNELKSAKLDTGTLAAITGTIGAGIQRTLELAVSFELGNLPTKGAAFLYEIDLASIDGNGRNAVENALRCDLSSFLGNEGSLPAGITTIQSIFSNLKQSKHTLRINLLGIYNFISVSKLALKGQTLFSPETGELTLTDTATASSIQAGLWNIGGKWRAADYSKLRKLLASSFLLTASYRASGLVLSPPHLALNQTYCEVHEETDRETMQGELGAAVGLKLLTAGEKNNLLGGIQKFGRTVVYASASYDDSLTKALFLQGETPRPSAAYEAIGRQAMQIAIHDDGADPLRLQPLEDNDLWKKMKQAGQSGFQQLFPSLSDTQRGAITADYTTIVWWAKTMSDTAQKLAEVRKYLLLPSASNTDKLEGLRSDLAGYLQKVAADTREEFGRPWGMIATDQLAGSQSNASIVFTGPVINFARQRRQT